MPDLRTFCILALGGNTGDTVAYFRNAMKALEHGGFHILRVSSFSRTKPEGMAEGTPDFLNGVVSGSWEKTPRELLELCQQIERDNGRPSEHPHYVSRTLDLDIILFGHDKIQEPDLTIPHPLASGRSFVLDPLREIDPESADWLVKNSSVFMP